MALSHDEQMLLRLSLEKVSKAFFRQVERKKAKILAVGRTPAKEDAIGLLAVLSHWSGEIIAGAPAHMKDPLFLAFADSVVTTAGIKEEDAQAETVQ